MRANRLGGEMSSSQSVSENGDHSFAERSHLQPLRERLEKMLGTGPFAITGGVFAVSTSSGETSIVSAGVDAASNPISEDSLMPLASASKLATGLLILRLIDRGLMQLDAHIGDYLPDAAAASTPGVTIRRLLSHTAGMPLEIRHQFSDPPGPIRWQDAEPWPGKLAEACLTSPPATEPGTAVQYSNVGFGLLGLAAARAGKSPFARLMESEVFEPLSIEAYIAKLPERKTIVIGDIPSPLVGTEGEPYNSAMSLVNGTPWANVISDIRGLLALVRAYGGDGGLLSAELSRAACSDQTGGGAGGFASNEPFLGHGPSRTITWNPCPWGLSVEVQGGKLPHWAPANLPSSFGQIGSSGCLAWCDPASGTAWAVLGARTTESGWLLRHGGRIAQTALAFAAAQEPASVA